MDDAELRRGQPALHKQIGEADTILAAFALLSRAFRLAAQVPELGRKERDLPTTLVSLLENAIGCRGMCEGVVVLAPAPQPAADFAGCQHQHQQGAHGPQDFRLQGEDEPASLTGCVGPAGKDCAANVGIGRQRQHLGAGARESQ